jgi:hypothetical protein
MGTLAHRARLRIELAARCAVMNAMGYTAAKTGRAVYKTLIAGTREEVYRELTRSDRPLGAWPNTRLYTPGLQAEARLQLRTANGEHTLVDGIVLAHEPPRRFSHTMCYTRFRDPAFVVTYELRDARIDVELTLTLDELPLGTHSARHAMREASHLMASLKHVVEKGKPDAMTRLRHIWHRLMEFSLPPDMLAERWPIDSPRRTTTRLRA